MGSQEADPFEKENFNESIAKAIMSLKTGDIATVESPLVNIKLKFYALIKNTTSGILFCKNVIIHIRGIIWIKNYLP